MIDTSLRDLRYAARVLRKNPAFTTVAVVTLPVGIGVNTAVFSGVYALLLKPLPYPQPERLATIRVSLTGARGDVTRDSAIDGAPFWRFVTTRQPSTWRHRAAAAGAGE